METDAPAGSGAGTQERAAHERWRLVLLCVGFALWFWLLRGEGWRGGDSDLRARTIGAGQWFENRQALSYILLQALHRVTGGLLDWPGQRTIALASCLAGGAAMAVTWMLLEGMRHRAWAFAVVATAGFTGVFYGHIETYALPTLGFLFHFLACKRVFEKRWPFRAIALTWWLTVALHMVACFVAPAVLAATILAERREGRSTKGILHSLAWFLPGIATAWFLSTNRLTAGEPIGPEHFGYWLAVLRGDVAVWEAPQNRLKVLFLLWTAGVAALVGAFAAGRALLRPQGRELDFVLGCHALCLGAWFLVWDPHMGEADWDLFAFPGMVLTFVAARNVMQLRGRSVLFGLIVGTQLLVLSSRQLPWALERLDGHGELRVEIAIEDWDNVTVILDEREPLRERHRFLPAGGHTIKLVHVPSETIVRRAFILERGDTVRYRVTDQEVVYLGTEE